MFEPSRELTEKVLDASPTFKAEILLRFATAERNRDAPVDVEQAQRVLAEQVVGEIGMVSRHRAAPPAVPVITLAAADRALLDPEFERHFQRYLRLSPASRTYRTIKRLLARDLLDWVQKGAADIEQLGLSADLEMGFVYLKCRPLEAVLSPLPEEG